MEVALGCALTEPAPVGVAVPPCAVVGPYVEDHRVPHLRLERHRARQLVGQLQQSLGALLLQAPAVSAVVCTATGSFVQEAVT